MLCQDPDPGLLSGSGSRAPVWIRIQSSCLDPDPELLSRFGSRAPIWIRIQNACLNPDPEHLSESGSRTPIWIWKPFEYYFNNSKIMIYRDKTHRFPRIIEYTGALILGFVQNLMQDVHCTLYIRVRHFF